MIDSRPIEMKEYFLAAIFRRLSVGLALFTWCLFGGVILLVHHVNEEFALPPRVLLLAAVAVPGAFVLYTYHWRIRIDDRGVHLRNVIVWRTWPWEDFESGRIHKLCGAFVYLGEEGRGPEKTLHLAALGGRHEDEAMEICQRRWDRPPEPEPADRDSANPSQEAELKIRYAATIFGIPRRTLHLDSKGITETGRRRVNRYPWDMVRGVEIMRYDYDDEDFRRLTIRIPEKTIKLRGMWREGVYKTSWSRANGAELVALIRAFVPDERITDVSRHGRPRDVEDVESRLAIISREIETDKRSLPYLVGGVFAVLAVVYALWTWFTVLLVILVAANLPGAFIAWRRQKRTIGRLKRYREALMAAEAEGDPNGELWNAPAQAKE